MLEGRKISHYRIVRSLGGGGMGVVYEAEDTRLGRPLALKFLPEGSDLAPAALDRFQREARTASALNHPNICTIYDIGEHEGRPFLAMELLEGDTLEARLDAGPVPLGDLVRWGRQITDALDAAHGRGIVHRDIKPANIFINERGDAKVLDFGLAKLAGGPIEPGDETRTRAEQDLTHPGAAVGTVAYMSPEQALGKDLDARSDLFSLGVVLYQMATGKRAFTGTTTAATFDAILNHAPTAPVRLNPEVSPELERIIQKALEKDRDTRYQSSAEMRADFLRMQRDSDASRSSTSAPAQVAADGLRRPKWWLPAGLVLVALVAVVIVVILATRDAGPPTIADGRSGQTSRVATSIAVLPLQNLASIGALDHLAFALSDEVTTTLSYAEGLNVRPFAQTRRYVGDDVDPLSAGRELHAETVVTGHFLKEGARLRVSLEAIDVAGASLTWRDSVVVDESDMIGMRRQITTVIESGLLPLLGATHPGAGGEENRLPSSEEAYDLYLRGVAQSTDPAPTAEAIRLFEGVLELDPEFAPAWARLGVRRYHVGQNDGAWSALRRAVELDPGQPIALGHLVVMHTEAGDAKTAWQAARALFESRSGDAISQFVVAYVLRYAGLLAEAKEHCDRAHALDPANPNWRSCSIPFYLTGDREGALRFLEEDSEWTAFAKLQVGLRYDDREDVLRMVDNLAYRVGGIEGNPRVQSFAIAAGVDGAERFLAGVLERTRDLEDPEALYQVGALLASAGYHEDALFLIEKAVRNGYWVGEAFDLDPALGSLRGDPRLIPIREESKRLQREFLEIREGNVL